MDLAEFDDNSIKKIQKIQVAKFTLLNFLIFKKI